MSETAPSGAIKSGESYVEFIAVDGKLNRSLTSIGNRLKTFGSFATRAGALLSAAGAGGAAGMIAMAKSASDAGSAVDDMAQRTGVAIKFISEMRYAAAMSGTSIEAFEAGIVAMSKALYGADEESKTAIKTLSNLGLSINDLKGKAPEEAFLDVADALSKIDDPTRRSALAMKVLGKAGSDLLPLMNGGRKGIEDLQAAAEKMGYSMSTEDAQAAAALGDSLDSLEMSVAAVRDQVSIAAAGPLKEFAESLQGQVPVATQWIKEHQGAVATVTKLSAGAAVAGSALTAFGIAATGVSMGLSQAVGAANGLMKLVGGMGGIVQRAGLYGLAAVVYGIASAIKHWAGNQEELNRQIAIGNRLNSELDDIDRKRTQKGLDKAREKKSLGAKRKELEDQLSAEEKNLQASSNWSSEARSQLQGESGWFNSTMDVLYGSADMEDKRQNIKDADARVETKRRDVQAIREELDKVKAEQADQEKMNDAMKPSTLKWAGRVGGRFGGMAQNWGQGVLTSGQGLVEAAKEQSGKIGEADLERRRGLFDEAKSIKESNKTPAERRKERLARLDTLRGEGAISDQDAAMERAKIGLEAAQEKADELGKRTQSREQLNLGISDDQKSLLAAQAGKMNAEDQTAKNTADSAKTLDELLIATRNLNQYLTQNGVALVEADG